MLAIALSIGGPAEGALRDKDPSDPTRTWELWKANVLKKEH